MNLKTSKISWYVHADDNEATLKQLVQDGPVTYIRALNKDYPYPTKLLDKDHVVCGVVIELKRDVLGGNGW